jgi:hypothetical protein
MRIELKIENQGWEAVVQEAEEILGRLAMHQGNFEYFSTVKEGAMFRLVIRPMNPDRVLQYGQPCSYKYSELYFLKDSTALPNLIARYHHPQ